MRNSISTGKNKNIFKKFVDLSDNPEYKINIKVIIIR